MSCSSTTTAIRKHLPWEDWREGDDLHTSGWMRATSPSGDAGYEGEGAVVGRARLRRRAPEGGQSGAARRRRHRQSQQLRDTLERHLRPSRPAARQAGHPGRHRARRWTRPQPLRASGPGEAPPRGRRALRRGAWPRPTSSSRDPTSATGVGGGPDAPRRSRRSSTLAAPPIPRCDVGVFCVGGRSSAGAIGVVLARNPVHSALMLVMTLFGVAVLFVLQNAPFLAAVQVIVYAGAIVVLFLFVIMFLGVDREENIAAEPLRGQRPLAVALVLLGTTGLLLLGRCSLGDRCPARRRSRHRTVERRPPREIGVHHLPVPLRGHGRTAGHRGGRRSGAGPPSEDTGARWDRTGGRSRTRVSRPRLPGTPGPPVPRVPPTRCPGRGAWS